MTFLAVLILTVALVVDAEDLLCDPHTQFEKDGECCQMCPPGTKMRSQSLCNEPSCEPCEENEYLDSYNTEHRCRLQPYCDPNKNFENPVQLTKTVKHVCLCKEGFHCSSTECITCVAHTTCGVGFGVQTKGSHGSDTVCEKCTDGTFSNESSAEDACRKWTECGVAYFVEKVGTDRSDNICAKDRGHVIAIVIPVLVLVLVGAVLGVWCFCKRRSGSMKQSAPINNFTNCLGPEPYSLTTIGQVEPRTPEETDEIGMTENGNCVVQEHGNAVKLSRQESQMNTTSECSCLVSSSSQRLEMSTTNECSSLVSSSCQRLNSF